MNENKRQAERIPVSFPILLSFGSQITLQGQLKDISAKSAFVKIKSSIYMAQNDELNFVIQSSAKEAAALVQGSACISRIAKGEGIAIYFTRMDEDSRSRLQEIVDVR